MRCWSDLSRAKNHMFIERFVPAVDKAYKVIKRSIASLGIYRGSKKIPINISVRLKEVSRLFLKYYRSYSNLNDN